ncbi:hypothetical protein GCM10028827_19220 [Mucilaginibacter myungsuensis]
MITSKGIMDIPAMILGAIRKPGALTPMISSASICSVTRMVPISDAMLDPTRPAKTSAEIVGLNSNIVESREILPAILLGTSGLANWNATWIVATAPINTEMMQMMPKEPTPIETISRITSFQ